MICSNSLTDIWRGRATHGAARYWTRAITCGVHDSQVVDELLMRGNTASRVWADAAYRSEEIEAKLRARGLTSRIHRKGKRGRPLTEQAMKSNRTSSVRVRVEHVFGAQANDMGGTLVRTIGLARARARIGMKNLAYNIRRLGNFPLSPDVWLNDLFASKAVQQGGVIRRKARDVECFAGKERFMREARKPARLSGRRKFRQIVIFCNRAPVLWLARAEPNRFLEKKAN